MKYSGIYVLQIFQQNKQPGVSGTTFCVGIIQNLQKTSLGHKALPSENMYILCSTQLPVHQRMNANGNWYQMIYFPEINNTMKHSSCYGYTV
jgi:hypothetical protein